MSAAAMDPNDFLNSAGVPSAKFPEIGTVVKGVIQNCDVQQQRDFNSGEPKFYDDGKPMMQLVITVATDERDPEVENDDGQRRIFAKGQLLQAVRSAVRQAGGRLTEGGTLAVKYVSDKPPTKRGQNPAKQYVAQYQPPSTSAVNDLLSDEGGGLSGNDLI